MNVAKTNPTVSERLRAAIKSAGVSRYRIAKDTGLAESMLSRFLRDESGLDLPTVDKLAAYRGLDLLPVNRQSKGR